MDIIGEKGNTVEEEMIGFCHVKWQNGVNQGLKTKYTHPGANTCFKVNDAAVF